MRPTSLIALLAFAACNQGGGSTSEPGPPRLDPLPGTGEMAIEMNGLWVVDDVTVLSEAPNATQPLTTPAGLMPPVVGAELVIDGDQAVTADDRDLSRDASGHPGVRGFLNQVDGRHALYYRYSFTPPDPQLADSGSAEWLQFAFGSVDGDTMRGLVQHGFAVAFPPNDRPANGLYEVRLWRGAQPRGR